MNAFRCSPQFRKRVKAELILNGAAKPSCRIKCCQLQSNTKQYNLVELSSDLGFLELSSKNITKKSQIFGDNIATGQHGTMRLPKPNTSRACCLHRSKISYTSSQTVSPLYLHLKETSGSETRKHDFASRSRVPCLILASEQSSIVASRRQQRPIKPISQRDFHIRKSHAATVSVTCPTSSSLPSLSKSLKP